jgi:hypothetical protein
VSCVFGILVDRAGFVEVTPAVSIIWSLGSRFDMDITLHVAGCYGSRVAQPRGMLDDDEVLRER